MTSRIISAAVALGLFAVGVALNAQEGSPSKTASPAGQIKDNLSVKEQILARQYQEFEQQLLRLKQRLERSNKQEERDQAIVLDRVLEYCKERSISVQFEQMVDILKSKELKSVPDIKQALERSTGIADELRKVIEMLREDTRAKVLRDDRLKLEQIIKDLEKVIQDQKTVQAITDRNKTDSGELKKIQESVTKKTADIAQRLSGKDGSDPKNTKGDVKASGKHGDKAGEAKGDGEKTAKDGGGKDSGGKDSPSKDGKGSDGGAQAKDGKDGQGKDGGDSQAKGGDGKDGQSKDGKGSDGGAQAKDGKDGQGKDGAGQAKDGGKGGDPKSGGDPAQAKGGDPKGGDGKGGDGKGQAKDGKGGDAQAKSGKGGEGGGESGKSGKGGGEGGKASKGQAKAGQKSDGQSQAKGGGDSKSGQDGGQQGPPQSQAKDGGQQGGPPKGGPQKDTPQVGKKEVESGYEKQQQAEAKIAQKKNDEASNKQGQAIEDLEKAKKDLEKLLRQIREEELERVLAALQARCEKMLAMQMQVLAGTEGVAKAIDVQPDKQPDRANKQESLKLSDNEGDIVVEATKAIEILEAEGSAVAFPEVFQQVRDDMRHVQRRLGITDVGAVTQRIERDIIDSLKEMIEALKKQRKELADSKSQPGQPGQSPPNQDQKLLEQIAELKMIRSLQVRVNNRTQDYAKMYQGEQAGDQNVRQELRNLSDRQERIFEITNRIAKGDNR